MLIGNVCVAVVLLAGGFRVLGGELAVGVLLALILSTKRFFQPVDQMAMFYNSFQSAQAALEKVSGLLEEVPTVRPPQNPVALHDAKGTVDFTGVEFRYGDGPVVIPAMDLHIPAGQTVALVGQTGAGKSTLAKLIARFYDVSSGSLTLDGVDLRAAHRRRTCGGTSSWSPRRPSCSAAPWRTTSPWAGPRPPGRRSRPPPRRWAPTGSSWHSRKATTPTSTSAAAASPPASGSSSASRAPSWPGPPC